MKWPFLRRSTHMKELVAFGESYRWEITEAKLRAAEAEAKLEQWVRQLGDIRGVERDYAMDRDLVLVEVSRYMQRNGSRELAEYLSRILVSKLFNPQTGDYRGDMRDDRPWTW